MPISRSAATTEVIQQGGSTISTIDSAAIQSSENDHFNRKLSIHFGLGTPANNTFAVNSRVPGLDLIIDEATGAWRTNLGTSGTLTAGQLANVQNDARIFKNRMENIANAIGLIPGTHNPWV